MTTFRCDRRSLNSPRSATVAFVALSYSGVNQLRAQKYHEAKRKGFKLISYISSKASYFGSRAVNVVP